MKDKKHIEREVDKTLNSIEGINRALPEPYLFTRVKARLEKEEKSFWYTAVTFISRPVVAFTTIIIAVLINALIVFELRSETSQPANEEEQLFANEYNLTNNTIYDSTIEPQ